MWDCNNGSGDNRVPTLGQPISYDPIFLRGDSELLSPLSNGRNPIGITTRHHSLSCCLMNLVAQRLIGCMRLQTNGHR